MSKATIGSILLHDATLTHLQIFAGGVALLRFDGVSVYRRVSSETEDIWLHSAKLSIEGVTDITVHGPPWSRKENDDYVLEDTIINARGEEIHWVDIDREGIQKIELLIFSGARIEIRGTRAHLKLSRKKEKVGQWKGPFV